MIKFKGAKREYFIWGVVYAFFLNIMFTSIFPLVYRLVTVESSPQIYLVGIIMSTFLGLIVSLVLVHEGVRNFTKTYRGVATMLIIETLLETAGFIMAICFDGLRYMLLAIIVTNATTGKIIGVGVSDIYKIKYIAEDQIYFNKYHNLAQYIGATVGGIFGILIASSGGNQIYDILLRNIGSILISTACLYDLYLIKKVEV